MKPTVSIITPTYNHESFISKCISSVQNQTYRNWEMIIIDDFSKDDTSSIIQRYVKTDKRIKLIRHSYNWGIPKLVKTYNQALNIAQGKYISILEGDDFWSSQKLERQVKELEKDSTRILIYSDWVITTEEGQPLKIITYPHKKDVLNNNPVGSIFKILSTLHFFIHPATVTIRRTELVKIGGFKNDKSYPFVDIPTFLHLALRGRFFYEKDIFAYYRKQKHSSWIKFAKNSKAMGRIEMRKCICTFLRRHRKANIPLSGNTSLHQHQIIVKKRKCKSMRIFLNYLLLKNSIHAKRYAFSMLIDTKGSLLQKFFLILLLPVIPLRKYAYFIFYKIDFILYIFSKSLLKARQKYFYQSYA